MAGRTNIKKRSKIKKCKPEDKKKGRKHPIKDQKFCLWDSDGDDILYAAPSRQDAEGQERSVQYHSHNGAAAMEVVEHDEPVTIARISHPDIPRLSGLEIHGFDSREVEYEVEAMTDHLLHDFAMRNGIKSGSPELRRLERGLNVDWKEVPLSGYGEYREFFGHDPDVVEEEWKQLADEGILYLEVEDYHLADEHLQKKRRNELEEKGIPPLVLKELMERMERTKFSTSPGMKKLWDELSPLTPPPYRKPQASVVINGQVFRRSLIQAAVPGAPTWKLRVALTGEEMESKLRPWLAKLVPFAHKIEDEQESLLEQLPRKSDLIKRLQSNYPSLVKGLDVNKMVSAADAYGDVGLSLVEISNDLQELFRQRSTYSNYLKQIAPAFDKVGEDDPTKMLFLEAVASLHADEVIA